MSAYAAGVTDSRLPGEGLVRQGIADLLDERESPSAMVVAMAGDRLRAAGVDVPGVSVERPAHRLYALLAAEDAAGAHSRYNALLRQIASYARAAESATARR